VSQKFPRICQFNPIQSNPIQSNPCMPINAKTKFFLAFLLLTFSFSSHPWICTAVDYVDDTTENENSSSKTPSLNSIMKVNMAAENQIKNAPSVSPAMVVRLGDIAASSIKSYTALWDPSLRSVSFMPQSKISAGRVRPWFTPQNATTASSRVAFARAQVIQQLRDARMDPLEQFSNGLGAGSPNLNIILFGNDPRAPNLF